jgi:von Willebrand factor type A domain
VAPVRFLVFMTAIAASPLAQARSQDDAPPAQKTQAPTDSSSSTKKANPEATSTSKSTAPAKPATTTDEKLKSPTKKPSRTKKKASTTSSKTQKSNRDSEVRVLTQDEMKKRRSEFLQPPGSSTDDRYAPDDDWYEVPPWRKTTFFGIRARGQFFVYVVDCSGSMLDDDRLTRATIEVRKSVMGMQEPQKFEVIFYNNESMPMPGGPRPRTADLQAKNQLLGWLRLIEPDGGTDPRPALRQAISLKPDAVFLLSDGEFPEGTVQEVAKLNTRNIPIHCVDLAGGLAGDHLKTISAQSGGQYASRPGSLHVAPPSRTDRRP